MYKGKTITMIVNYPAGGPTDIEGRIIAHHLPAHIPGKPNVIVKNMGGAGGMIGSNFLGESPSPTARRSASSPGIRSRNCSAIPACGCASRLRAARRRAEPAGGLYPQGHAARPQHRRRPDEGQGVQDALARHPQHQHGASGARARPAGRQVQGGDRLQGLEGGRDRDPAERWANWRTRRCPAGAPRSSRP